MTPSVVRNMGLHGTDTVKKSNTGYSRRSTNVLEWVKRTEKVATMNSRYEWDFNVDFEIYFPIFL